MRNEAELDYIVEKVIDKLMSNEIAYIKTQQVSPDGMSIRTDIEQIRVLDELTTNIFNRLKSDISSEKSKLVSGFKETLQNRITDIVNDTFNTEEVQEQLDKQLEEAVNKYLYDNINIEPLMERVINDNICNHIYKSDEEKLTEYMSYVVRSVLESKVREKTSSLLPPERVDELVKDMLKKVLKEMEEK